MNWWQLFLKWGDSALVTLGGIAAIPAVQALIAHLVPALGPWIPVILAAAGVAHITLAPQPTSNVTPKIDTAVKGIAMLILPALLSMHLAGCSWLQSQAGATVELSAVDSAIAVAEQKGVSAATINALAHLAQVGDTVAVGILSGILTKANPSLTEAQAALAAALAEAIKVTAGGGIP